MKRLVIWLAVILLLASCSLAANIHGSIYDLGLNKLKNVVLEINTEPSQRYVSVDGSYSFSVGKGNYVLTAVEKDKQLVASENISIKNEGDYNYDLFLVPDTSKEEEILLASDIEIESLEREYGWVWYLVGIIIIVILAGIFYYKKRCSGAKTIEESDLKSKVISIIKAEGGRISQKELRKKLPFSEAKISLVITELEHEGKIEKIKKGRANVLVLK